MKIKEQCSTCKFYKPFVNYKMGNCGKDNMKSKIYDQTCDKWQKGKNI